MNFQNFTKKDEPNLCSFKKHAQLSVKFKKNYDFLAKNGQQRNRA